MGIDGKMEFTIGVSDYCMYKKRRKDGNDHVYIRGSPSIMDCLLFSFVWGGPLNPYSIQKKLEFLATHEEKPQQIEGIGWTEPSLWCLHACIPSTTHVCQWRGRVLDSLRLRQIHLLLTPWTEVMAMSMCQFDPQKKSWS
jgi:hypothetical protein